MSNVMFELDKLRLVLQNKGFDGHTIESIVDKARAEIHNAFEEHGNAAMQLAIEKGVSEKSPEFINDLKLDATMMQLITDSGNLNFPQPPRPMLPQLLKNARPMKDGTGVYKVIPVGAPGKDKPKVSMSIYDSWKQLNAERIENARRQYKTVAPQESKFRTASSKQDASTQWVKQGKDNDFSEDMRSINKELEQTMDQLVRDIIRSYEEGF